MNSNQSGGDIIGLGSFGCVFRPAIKCSNQKTVSDDMVSKVFFSSDSKKEAAEEIKIDKIIKQIKGNQNWSHIWDKNCVPKKYSSILKEEPSIQQCLDENRISEDNFDKYRRLLQGTYAGKPFGDVVHSMFSKSTFTNKTLFVTNFHKVMKLMKPLFIGLVEMNNSKVSHNDIKPDNIMIDDDGCKFIDFGLAAKHTNTRFYKQRSMSEFVSDRIYPSYPYEFIYLYANKDVLEDEKNEKQYDIYRDLHDRYQDVHEKIFNRTKLKEYLLGLINYHLEHGLEKHKLSVISMIDTYSVGILFPGILVRIAKRFKKMKELQKMMHNNQVKPFIELFKDMADPDHHERIPPKEALRRYLELEILYLGGKPKVEKNLQRRRVRRVSV